jgi:hypothetical protein
VIEVMAFSEFELKKIEKALAKFMKIRRPPAEIRSEVDLGYRLYGQSLELFEIRPQWDNPSIIREHQFAKATFISTQKHWKIFWHRADLKWHGYKPDLTVPSIEKFFEVVTADEYGCFFG